MARKTFEIAFNIAGNLAGTFRSSFSSASAQMDKLKGSSQSLKASLRSLESGYKSGAMSAAQFQASQAKVAQSLERVQKAQERLNAVQRNQQLLQQNASEIQGKVASSAASVIPFVGAAKAAMDFETAMLGVAKQVQGARDDSGKLTATYYQMQKQIQMLGREIPIPTNEIARMVESAARMNVPKQHLISFTREVAKMATAFEAPPDQIAEAMGKVANNFKIPLTQITGLADAINYLDDNSISKGNDIIDVLNRISGVAATAKMSAKDAAAFGSTLLTLGETAETASTPLNAIMQRLGAAEKGTDKFQAAIKEIGLSVKDVQKGMSKDATGTLLKVFDAIKKLPSDKRGGVMVELAGLDHSDVLAKLVDKTDELRRQLKLANGEAAKGSMSREFAARMQTTQAQLDLMKNSATQASAALGSTLLPTLNKIFNVIADGANKMADFAEAHPKVTQALVMSSAALVGLRLGWLGVKYGVNSARTAINGVQTVLAKGAANAAARSANKAANSAKGTAGGAGKVGGKGSAKETAAAKSSSSTPKAGAGGAAAKATGKAASKLATAGKVLSKAALPLTIAAEGYNIYKSNDKTKATVQAAGGIAGGLAGAKLGAMIGTAIAPGIGTAIGSLVFGLGGYIAGKWTSGKATDAARVSQSKQQAAQAGQPGQPGAVNAAAVNQQISALVVQMQTTIHNFRVLTMYTGQASGQLVGAFFPLVSNIKVTAHNFSVLTRYVGLASGWIVSINGVQAGAAAVKSALNNLAQRINSVPTPSVSAAAANGGGVKKYARGGIINHPHIGLVGEAGRESIIPWKKSPRSFSLWAQTGKALGFTEKANALSSNGGTTIIHYSPVFHGVSKQEIQPVLKQETLNLADKLKAISHQNARVSFA